MNLTGNDPNRPRNPNRRYVETRSGKQLRVNTSISARWRAMREGKNLRQISRMRSLPKSRFKRFLWRLQPSHLKEFWLSRDGAVAGAKIVGLGILGIFVLIMLTFVFFRKDLKAIHDIALGGNFEGSISYYDRTNKVLLFQDYNGKKRVPVQSNQIGKYMKDATIAAEDRGFYSEPGFSVRGVARATANDLLHRSAVQGGSTITEQLVKMTENWSLERNILTKMKELILAIDLDRTYSKDEILTAYLNVAPYGGVDYGVQVAASDYFHTSADKLTLPQAAMMAAIPNSPSLYSPYGPIYDSKALEARYNYVLQSMVDTHAISQAQADAAAKSATFKKVSGVFPQQNKYSGIKDPYFVLAAKKQLYSQFINPDGSNGSSQIGGWRVVTTMDVKLQNEANRVTAADLPLIKQYGGDVNAFAAEDVKTGQMVALVGGQDFTNTDYGQINYAQWPISPGSSFKPYDYSTFINNNNAGAGSVLYDTVGPLPGYGCHGGSLNNGCLEDYDFRSPGPMSLRYALGGSRNIPAVKAMLQADPNDHSDLRADSVNTVINMANALMNAPGAYNCFADNKQTVKTQCYGSAALGDGAYLQLDQHVNGLASLARLGVALPQTYILQIYDSTGKQIYNWTQPKGTQVMKPDAAYIVDNMASDPRASYLPGSCTTGANATCTPLPGGYKFHRINGWVNAVKTGTTGNSFDGLMTSWNTQYAAAAWVGYHTRNVPLHTFMEVLTEPITRPWMEFALNSLHTTPVNWQQPSDIQTLPAYVLNHKISRNGEQPPSPSTDIYPSWYKPRTATAGSFTIDKVSGLLSTNCTPADAKQNVSGSQSANLFSVDQFYGSQAGFAGRKTPSASDDVHKCSDDLPSISSLNVTPLSNGKYNLSASAKAGSHPLTGGKYGGTISFAIDGNTIATVKMDSSGSASLNYTNTKYSGNHTVTATVTDSVLYQGSSAPQTIKFSKSGVGAGPQNLIGDGTNFSWSGGTPNYTIYEYITGSSGPSISVDGCQSVSSTSCTASPPHVHHGSYVYVQDSNGIKSSAIQV